MWRPPSGPKPGSWRLAMEPIPSLLDWYRKNKVSSALLLAAFVIAKCYVIARGDVTTALGIVQYAGVASVAVAAVMSSLALLAAAMLALACFRLVWPEFGEARANRRELLPVALVAFVFAAVLTPVWVVAGAILLGVLFGWSHVYVDRLEDRKLQGLKTRRKRRAVLLIRLGIGVGSAYAVLAMLYTVWLPNEIVKFNPGTSETSPVVAYVLAEDTSGSITLLESVSRQIVRHPDEDVMSHSVCHFTPHGGWSEVAYASTLWAIVTKQWHDVGPVHSVSCPPQPRARKSPPAP
jgi:hypothetical protein